jgi:Effector Associated Constant Component 1
VDVTIKAAEGAGADVYRWLAADPPVRSFGASAVPAGREPGDGTMGTGFDLLNLIVPNAIALAGLLVSLAAFRDQRRATTGTPPSITVAAGATVVTITSATDAQLLAAQLLQAPAAPPAQPGATPSGPGTAPAAPPAPGAPPPPAPLRPPAQPPAVPPPTAGAVRPVPPGSESGVGGGAGG